MRDRPAPVRYDDVVHAVIAEVVAAAERLVRVQQGFVGETLGATIDDREDGTLAATALAAHAGTRVFRAHQVRRTRLPPECQAAARLTACGGGGRGGMPPSAVC